MVQLDSSLGLTAAPSVMHRQRALPGAQSDRFGLRQNSRRRQSFACQRDGGARAFWKRLPQIEESRQLLLVHPCLLKHLLDRLAELYDGAPYLGMSPGRVWRFQSVTSSAPDQRAALSATARAAGRSSAVGSS